MTLFLLTLLACGPGLELDWNVEVGNYSPAPAVSQRGNLVTSSYDPFSTAGTVKAHAPSDGSEVWRYELATSTGQALALDTDDRVLVAEDDGLLALDADSGEEVWRVDGLGSVFSLAVDVNLQRVYALTRHVDNGQVYLLHALEGGAVVWSESPAMVPSLLAVGADGTVYVVGSQAQAFDPEGQVSWSVPLPSAAQTLALDRDKLLVATLFQGEGTGGLLALSRQDGAQLWLSEHNGIWEPVVAEDGTIYAATDVALVALDGGTGGTLWVGHEMHREVAIGGDGRLYGMGYLPEDPEYPSLGWPMHFTVTSAGDGEILWQEFQFDALDSANGAPSFDGRRVYFCGGYFRSHMYAYVGGPGLGRGPWPRTNAGNANRRQELD